MSFSTARRVRAGGAADRWRSDVGAVGAMGVTIFRPGQGLVIPGVTVMQPRPSAAAANWWDVAGQTCIAAYAAKGAASLAASYTNLTGNATYNAAPGVAPTFDTATGWTFNGSTQYLTTGIAPAGGWSMIVRFSTLTNVDCIIVGSQAAGGASTTQFMLIPRSASGASRTYRNGGDLIIAGGKTDATMAIAGSVAYLDGAAETGSMANALSGAQIIFIGCRNNGGTANSFAACKIQALAIYSTTLTAGDVATLTTAMAAL